ncbi:MAG: L-threonylcarbamoyladenylate synthase [Candidatus Dormibacteria bacterium]|jgi:L-threonylcarbamoyladenylate synthase
MNGELWPDDSGGIELAAAAVAGGHVVGFPTDTVFGIGCAVDDLAAITRLAEIKQRPPGQPLILMAGTMEEVAGFVIWPCGARDLIQRFWPGPLTLIVEAQPSSAALGGGHSVGVRVPAHPTALRLLQRTGPLATSSANRHGQEPAVDARSAVSQLPGLAGALEDPDGPRVRGAASSILDVTRDPPVLIREGRLSARELGVPVPEQEPRLRRD